jgi:transcriptional regulator with XRE-family HTH domain
MTMRGLPKLLGQRLKQLREAQGLRVPEAAALLGIGVPHLYNVERGVAQPSLDLLGDLATVYKVDVSDLFVFPEAHPRHAARELVRLTPTAKLDEAQRALAEIAEPRPAREHHRRSR